MQVLWRRFATRRAREQHTQAKHPCCLVCQKQFSSPHALSQHALVKRHSTFSCAQCRKTFISSDALAQHTYDVYTINHVRKQYQLHKDRNRVNKKSSSNSLNLSSSKIHSHVDSTVHVQPPPTCPPHEYVWETYGNRSYERCVHCDKTRFEIEKESSQPPNPSSSSNKFS